MNIYLIGYRGTGKSSVAPILAQKLGPGWNWLDLDAELERRAGRSIAQIFQTDGETVFRDLEAEELARAAALDQMVVATGGGVIGRDTNCELLQKGWIAWLVASPPTILSRVRGDNTTSGRRPNLTTQGGLEEIEQLLAKRTPIYRRLADLEVSTECQSAEAAAEEIYRAFTADQTNSVHCGSREGD